MIAALGDSKSAPDSQTWPQTLASGIATATAITEGIPATVYAGGRGGYSVAQTAANIADILRLADHAMFYAPKYVLLNVGVNDVGFVTPWALPDQTTWKNNYRSVLSAIHTLWPLAQMFVTKPWKTQVGGDDTMWDTMAGWIDDLVAEQSYLSAGDDERSWFEPNVATYSDDGIHWNATGQAAAAVIKQTTLGY